MNPLRGNPFTVNPLVQGRGGFRPPREWLNGMRKAPRGSRNSIRDALAAARAPQPVRDNSCYLNVAVSECAFCAFFFMVCQFCASAA